MISLRIERSLERVYLREVQVELILILVIGLARKLESNKTVN